MVVWRPWCWCGGSGDSVEGGCGGVEDLVVVGRVVVVVGRRWDAASFMVRMRKLYIFNLR